MQGRGAARSGGNHPRDVQPFRPVASYHEGRALSGGNLPGRYALRDDGPRVLGVGDVPLNAADTRYKAFVAELFTASSSGLATMWGSTVESFAVLCSNESMEQITSAQV